MPSDAEYLWKNRKAFKSLDKKIKKHGDVVRILASTEMYIILGLSDHAVVHSDILKYRDIPVIKDDWMHPEAVRIVRKKDEIRFTLACLCGKWNDEPHSHELR